MPYQIEIKVKTLLTGTHFWSEIPVYSTVDEDSIIEPHFNQYLQAIANNIYNSTGSEAIELRWNCVGIM